MTAIHATNSNPSIDHNRASFPSRGAALATLSFALACSAAPELDLPGEAAVAVDNQEIRLAGSTPSTAKSPWEQRPTMFARLVTAREKSAFTTEQDRVKSHDSDYYPAVMASAKGSGAAKYAAVWHKSRRVTSAEWSVRTSDADFGALWQTKKDAGFRLYDYNVHVDGSTPYYDAVWVKENGQPDWASNRNLSFTELSTKITERRDAGFRAMRLEEYTVNGVRKYLLTCVKDGITRFNLTVGRTKAELQTTDAEFRANGYVPTDISTNLDGSSLRYSGIWTKNAEVLGVHLGLDLTESSFLTMNAEQLRQGQVLVDLNLNYNSSGSLRYSAIWHRTERMLFESNLGTNTTETRAIEELRSDLYADPVGGDRARLGFFVQDLANGDYIAHGADLPFYMASTAKVFIGAWIAKNKTLTSTIQLRPQDYRGEDRRTKLPTVPETFQGPGFGGTDFQNVSFSYKRFLEAMLTTSDTAATDRLLGIATQSAVQTMMRNSLGLQNIGEVTSICQLDKRIVGLTPGNECVHDDVSCDSFEAKYRRGEAAYQVTPGSDEEACLERLTELDADGPEHKDNLDAYYATRANSVTPSEFGHALQVLAGTSFLSNAQRADFIDALGPHDGYCSGGIGDVQYDSCATKGGTKGYAKAQVGIMFDFNGVNGDFTRLTPRYSFAIFADNLAASDGSNAEPYLRDMITEAVNFLVNH